MPVSMDHRKITVTTGAISCARSLRTTGFMGSGPPALDGVNIMSFKNPALRYLDVWHCRDLLWKASGITNKKWFGAGFVSSHPKYFTVSPKMLFSILPLNYCLKPKWILFRRCRSTDFSENTATQNFRENCLGCFDEWFWWIQGLVFSWTDNESNVSYYYAYEYYVPGFPRHAIKKGVKNKADNENWIKVRCFSVLYSRKRKVRIKRNCGSKIMVWRGTHDWLLVWSCQDLSGWRYGPKNCSTRPLLRESMSVFSSQSVWSVVWKPMSRLSNSHNLGGWHKLGAGLRPDHKQYCRKWPIMSSHAVAQECASPVFPTCFKH